MQKIRFHEAVNKIRNKDPRIEPDAYAFLRDALDFTVKRLRFTEAEEHRHVSGPELLFGFRDFALQEFGPLATTVLARWGVRRGEDIGAMVFQLIDVGAFGRSDEDCPEDFRNVLDLEEELQTPFRPTRKPRLIPVFRDRPVLPLETASEGLPERGQLLGSPQFETAENP